MDINLLFSAGMRACGRVLKLLPEKEIGSPTQYMTKIMKEETLPSFNDLHPYVYKTVLKTEDLIPLNSSNLSGHVGYRIPTKCVAGLKIRGIRACHPSVSNTPQGNINMLSESTGYIGASSWMSVSTNRINKYGRCSSANLYESVLGSLMTYADLQLLGTIQQAPIPLFEAPNIMWINGTYARSNSFYVELLLDNDPNLISIPEEAYEAFKKLFILDLKKSIYSEYGILSNIDTAVGNIDLRIDDWSSAASERDELFEQYDAMSHIRKTKIISG